MSVRTRLVRDPSDRLALNDQRQCDARTAITRGLAEYLLDASIDAPGGRLIRLRKTFSSWPDAEQSAEYPSALVTVAGDGSYDYASSVDVDVGGGRFLRKRAEVTFPLQVEIWSTDPNERAALIAMTEDHLHPVDWMYGCRLELPHYWNSRATYCPTGISYTDADLSATQRYRVATWSIKGFVTQYRMLPFPLAQPRFKLDVEDP